ncbi:hypothetical protein Tco_1535746, partial [Tanacetum coccineum]
VPTPPHDSPLPGGHTPGSDEGRMQQTELMDLVIKLSDKVKRLEKIVKSSKTRRRAKIVVSGDEKDSEDSSKQGRMIDGIDQDAGITLVTPTKTSTQEDHPEDQLGVLINAASRIISTAEETVSTVGASMPVSTAGLVQEITSSSRVCKDKGKAVIIESEPEQTASKNSSKAIEEIHAAVRQRMAKVHQATQGFTEDEWENIKARVEADEELTQKLQEEEREKYSKVDQAKMLVDLINQRKRRLKRSLKLLRRVHSFVPMDSELEVQRLKRAGQEGLEELAKREKIGEASESGE